MQRNLPSGCKAAALAPARRAPSVFGNGLRRLIGTWDAVVAAGAPAHRAPLAGLSRLRQLLLREGKRRQQHCGDDQCLHHLSASKSCAALKGLCTLKGSPAALQTAGASWRSGGVNGVGSNHFVRLLSTTLTFSRGKGSYALSRFAPRAGFVTLRQRFVRRCQNCLA
jgi:hypothetical protein